MKKLSLLISVGIMSFSVSARDFQYEYEGQTLIYTVLDESAGTCETKAGSLEAAGNNVAGSLKIPAIAKDGNKSYSVIKIGQNGFTGCSDMTSVEIPTSVSLIKPLAFCECIGLKSIAIPESVTAIGKLAFGKCRKLESVDLTNANSLTMIGDSAFYSCPDIRSIIVPPSVKRLGCRAFTDGVKLAYPSSLGDNVPWIDGTTYIPYNPEDVAFDNRVTYNKDKTKIICVPCDFEGAFTIPDGVTTIGDYAFFGCNIQSVNFPNTIVSMGKYAFTYCPLSSVTLPNSLTAIPDNAFRRCEYLHSVYIPNSVTSIGYDAFAYTNFNTIVIPNSVKTIEAGAFWFCRNLGTIILGNGLETIEVCAFSNTGSANIYITAKTPPVAPNDRTFQWYQYWTNLYVLGEDAVDTYRNSSYCWNKFTHINQMIEPVSLELNMTTLNGEQGDTFQLSATFAPADVSIPVIFWSSTNPEIASVDHNGLVTINSTDDESLNKEAKTCKIIAETFYPNGPKAEATVSIGSSGIMDNVIDQKRQEDNRVFDLNGRQVNPDRLSPGIYIRNGRKFIVR